MTAARLLNAASAVVAAGVAADSSTEHYRAGFHNPVMFAAPIASSAVLATALSGVISPGGRRALPEALYAASILSGLVGLGFHVNNVSRRPGGWTSVNVFHGAPIAAPLGATMAGVLGLAASRIGNGTAVTSRSARALGGLSALGLLGTSVEATALHFRGAFQNPFMYVPVVVPPAAAFTLAAASLTGSAQARATANVLLRLTAAVGMIGVGFHAWGVHRRMGGWTNWRQNLLAGPPLPAPPAFTGLALAGLAALQLLQPRQAR